MLIIDSHGKKFQLSDQQTAVFFASDIGIQLKEDFERGNQIDFSGIRPCLKAKYIKMVLEYAQDLECLTKKEVTPDETYLLDTANYLGVKQKEVLYHLANRVWSYLQTGRQKKDLQLSDDDETYVRKIAKPYLNSPERFSRVCRPWYSNERKEGCIYFDFSFKAIKEKDDQEYPFVLSDGIADLINIFRFNPCDQAENKIEFDLSGHAIKEFIIDDWVNDCVRYLYPHEYTINLNLANNGIERITWSKKRGGFFHPLSWIESFDLDFSQNPVKSIDSSVFELARFQRTRGKKFTLIIPHHKLSLQEVALVKQQWNLAVNTLVDQYSKGYNPNGINVIVAMLIVIGTGVVIDYGMQPNSVLLRLGGVMVGWLTLVSWLIFHSKILPRMAHKLALQTHPDMEKPETSFQVMLSTQNLERPLGNTWLEDWRKPQLILNEGE